MKLLTYMPGNPAARSFFAVVLLAACIGQASAQSVLSLHDEATGATQVFTPDDSRFSVQGDGTAISVAAVGPGAAWFMQFEAPEGETLAPGRYAKAGCRSPLRMGRAPGLEVTDNNPACDHSLGMDTLWGSFVIRQIAYDNTGRVTALEALFVQRKGAPDAPALGGFIRVDARPLMLDLQSDVGFGLGEISQRNHGDTSIFTLEGTAADGLDFGASVRKDTWRIVIDPPTGRQLRPGHYATRGVADAGRAGLLVLRGVDQPPRCSDPRGALDIQAMQVSPRGVIQSLRATFEYRCGNSRAALRGTIRYLE